jgi:S-DNA-T family DNA segregation ATPase FtsK/SpoIIIE
MSISAGPKPRKPRTTVKFSAGNAKRRANPRFGIDILGIVSLVLGLMVLATLLIPGNQDGGNVLGTAVVRGLRLLLGVGAWLFPLLMLGLGTALILGRNRAWGRLQFGAVLFALLLGWWHLGHAAPDSIWVPDNLSSHGGALGAASAWLLWRIVGVWGAHFMFAGMLSILVLAQLDVPLPALMGPVEARVRTGAGRLRERGADAVAARRRRMAARHNAAAENPEVPVDQTPEPDTFERKPSPASRRRPLLPRPDVEDADVLTPEDSELVAPVADDDPDTGSAPVGTARPSADEKYQLPSTLLLAAPKPVVNPMSNASSSRREVILQTLEDFGIGADVAHVSVGPTITRYEIALERGIKVNKIVALADNLAMAMAAIDVRVEAPIPGKSAIGIEVPNENPGMVTLRECLEAPEFQNAPGKLTFVLGKDVTGAVRVADLAKMPHMLIGGSTGSGKSVGLNTLITSLLYRNTPRDLKLVMIDPKKVELSLYDGIPHLASPVITNVKQAPSVFKQALREMETRYDKFAKAQTRNIEGYNAKVDPIDRMPYWVIVVDELADLMMTSGPEIETAICRLAQLARATGIHLVIATQRPSVNVITGTIKANISSRIAFAVNSSIDSRTILDQMGADRLIGRGDMLFLPIDAPKPQRIQGCFVSEQETERLVQFLKDQGRPNFDVLPSTLSSATGEDDSGEVESEDDLFEAAVRLVVTGGSASTSMLQRRFKIGYTRAARLVDMMEQKGIVGALDGAKPRDILITREQMEEMFDRTPVSD